jgi:hypothetical protein
VKLGSRLNTKVGRGKGLDGGSSQNINGNGSDLDVDLLFCSCGHILYEF